jgi:DNA-binding NtrC family response regulator
MDSYIIQTALERNGYNVTATARALGTTRETLRYRIQKYQLRTGEARDPQVGAPAAIEPMEGDALP